MLVKVTRGWLEFPEVGKSCLRLISYLRLVRVT